MRRVVVGLTIVIALAGCTHTKVVYVPSQSPTTPSTVHPALSPDQVVAAMSPPKQALFRQQCADWGAYSTPLASTNGPDLAA
jgi:hypothetical protein